MQHMFTVKESEMMAKKKRKGSTIQEGSAGATSPVLGAESVSKQTKSPWPSTTIKDARLIPRMKEYLEAKRNKKIVSISSIVDHLQSKYPEYGRKKKNMFAQYVEKAYAVLERQISGERTASSGPDISGCSEVDVGSSSESDSVEEILVEYKDTNAMNAMMSNMYRSSPSTVVSEPEEKKRKSELTQSVKKRQRTEDVIVLDKDISSSASPNKENGSAANFYIDRKGDSLGKSVTNSGDHSKETVQTYKGAFRRTLNLATPTEVKASDQESKSLNKDTDDKVIVQQSANIPISEIKVTTPHVNSKCDTEEAKLTKPIDTSEVLGSLQQGTETEATDTPSKSKRAKLTRKTKSRKQDDPDQEQEKSKKDKGPAVQKSTLTFADVGGNEQNLQDICKLLVHMRHPEVYLKLGVTPPRGFLLHGPPGCGKTLLANAIAGELDLPLIKIAATEIVSGVSGDSEEKIRELFEKAVQCSPCVMFIDEIDSITPKRETASKDMERRIVAQLLACMDDLNANLEAQVLVIGATNRPDSLDPALRRAGRFDREICLGIPDEQSRLRILQVLCRGLRLSPDFDFLFLAKNTPGYVGADLMALTREAAMSAVNRVFQELQSHENPEKSTPMEVEGQDQRSNLQDNSSDTYVLDKPLNDTCDSNSKAALEELHAADPKEPNTEIQASHSHELSTEIQPAHTSNSNESSDKGAVVADSSGHSNIEKVLPSQVEDCVKVSSSDFIDSSANSSANIDKESEETPKGTGIDLVVNDDSVVTNSGSSLTEQCQEEGASISSGTRTSDSTLDVDNVKHQSGATVDIVEMEVGSEHPSDIPAQDRGDEVKTVSDEHVNTAGANTEQKKQSTLISVLSWLKEQPPLTEEQLNDLYITMDDFKEALEHVQPSAKREGFATVPDVTWDDVGALHQVREELQLAILAPVRHAEEFRSLGLNRAQGILLAGPPGCGKTLLAKAVANESGINFISVKGPELLNMYVGESEKAVRTVFQRARNSSPCVIFFDELDALCPRRSGTADSGSSSRVVNQLLTEMDGLEERKQVFIMAATNRPDIIDPAVLRPGRLDKTLYVGLPTQEDRLDIFKCITKEGTRPCLAQDVELLRLAEDHRCDGYTGADLAALVREASVLALKKAILDKGRQPGDTIIVRGEHFEAAFSKIKPSVSVKDQDKYRALGQRITTVT